VATAAPSPNPDPEFKAFLERLFSAVCLLKSPVDKADILQWVLYEAMTRYTRNHRRGHERLIKSVRDDTERIPAPLARELVRIIAEEVRPALSADDQKNMDRTLRVRQGPLPDRRPPSYPRQAAAPREIRHALGL